MAVPISPYIITGRVLDIYGNNLEGATVTVTHATISPVLTDTSRSTGIYRANLGQLESRWSRGDTITIKATKAGKGRITVVTTIGSKGGTTINLTLEETSDIDFEVIAEKDRRDLVLVVPTLFDGTKVNNSNRLPVDTDQVLGKYYYSDTRTSGSTLYDGYVDRDENWYIRRENTSTGEIRYAVGSGSYPTAFTNRTTQTYKYFYDAF